jgi:hypothetical protein
MHAHRAHGSIPRTDSNVASNATQQYVSLPQMQQKRLSVLRTCAPGATPPPKKGALPEVTPTHYFSVGI